MSLFKQCFHWLTGRYRVFCLVLMVMIISCTFSYQLRKNYKTQLFAKLPKEYNTLDGMGMSPDGDIVVSVPNFNNDSLLAYGMIQEASPAFMAIIRKDNTIAHWYDFKPEDLHPKTGKVGPMDCEFGPDGNLYINDRQWFYDKDHQSRILRINVVDGKPTGVDVVVTGMMTCNGMYWQGNTLFVTESVLLKTDSVVYSGVYAFPIDDLDEENPVQVKPFQPGHGDEHLVVTFTSFNHLGSGADGITFDSEGKLYTTVIEEGKIYQSTLDEHQKVVETRLFVQNPKIVGPDGLIFSEKFNRFFLADYLANAVHAIDLEGHVFTLHQNADTDGLDGSLDQPCEVVLRGNELLIVNMDMAWASGSYGVNKHIDPTATISKIDLEPK